MRMYSNYNNHFGGCVLKINVKIKLAPISLALMTALNLAACSEVALKGDVAQKSDKSLVEQSKKKYDPTWESLSTAPVPEWLKDAKFGVYTHWGLYSVPAHLTNVYGDFMYRKDNDRGVRAHHEKTYGPIEEFGYKDFLPMFTAPKFNADEWVAVMEDAGAKYAGIHVVHHDGYCLWDSEYTKFDSMDTGPKKDIFGEITKSVRKSDMKLVATFHHARTYGLGFKDADKYTEEEKAKLDIFDPKYDYIYRNPETVSVEEFSNEWHNKIDEVIEKYQPDLLWFDGLAKGKANGIVNDERLLKTFSDFLNNGNDYTDETYLFNKLPASMRWNFPMGFGYRTYENGRDMEVDVRGDWNIDRSIGYPWTWVKDKEYQHSHDYHIRSLVDIVARGGSFLLSLTPKGDGSIPEREKEIMAGIGRWMRINGDAIYNTRPWKSVGEGMDADVLRVDAFRMNGEPKTNWDYTILDKAKGDVVRFTKNGNDLYAIVMGEPESGEIKVPTLALGNVEKSGKGIASVSLLGSDAKIDWQQNSDGLIVKFPKQLPGEIAYSFKITVKGELDQSVRPTFDDGIGRKGNWPIYKTKV